MSRPRSSVPVCRCRPLPSWAAPPCARCSLCRPRAGSSDGLHLPNALALGTTSGASSLARHRPGDLVDVSGGVLRIGPVGYRPVRWRVPREVAPPGTGRVDADVVDELARRLPDPHSGPLADRLAAATLRLAQALADLDVRAACAAADALLGLGLGLTPSGDDVLAGVLVTCAQLRDTPGAADVAAAAAGLGSHVRQVAPQRTCALSAALLGHATHGRAAPPVLGVVDALTAARPLAPALAALLAVGHTSGADTARGVLLAARALRAPTDARPEDR